MLKLSLIKPAIPKRIDIADNIYLELNYLSEVVLTNKTKLEANEPQKSLPLFYVVVGFGRRLGILATILLSNEEAYLNLSMNVGDRSLIREIFRNVMLELKTRNFKYVRTDNQAYLDVLKTLGFRADTRNPKEFVSRIN